MPALQELLPADARPDPAAGGDLHPPAARRHGADAADATSSPSPAPRACRRGGCCGATRLRNSLFSLLTSVGLQLGGDRRRSDRRRAVLQHEGHGLAAADRRSSPRTCSSSSRSRRSSSLVVVARQPDRSTCCYAVDRSPHPPCAGAEHDDATMTAVAAPAAHLGRGRTRSPYKRSTSRLGRCGVCWLVCCSASARSSPTTCRSSAPTTPRCKSTAGPRQYGLGPGWTAWFGTDKSGHDVFARCIYGARQTLIDRHRRDHHRPHRRRPARRDGRLLPRLDRPRRLDHHRLPAGHARAAAGPAADPRLDDLKDATLARLADPHVADHAHPRHLVDRPVRPHRASPDAGLREREFVLAARSLGASNRRIICREILPNLVPAMVTVAFTGLGILIAAEGGARLPRPRRRAAADVGQDDRRRPRRPRARRGGRRSSRA